MVLLLPTAVAVVAFRAEAETRDWEAGGCKKKKICLYLVFFKYLIFKINFKG